MMCRCERSLRSSLLACEGVASAEEHRLATTPDLVAAGGRAMPMLNANRTGRTKAQTMVEFALILPILLMIIYGLLEVGRLIFIYSTVVSASREAARYGSATGLNVAGGDARYRDCAGIQVAANNVDFLGVINNIEIIIAEVSAM